MERNSMQHGTATLEAQITAEDSTEALSRSPGGSNTIDAKRHSSENIVFVFVPTVGIRNLPLPMEEQSGSTSVPVQSPNLGAQRQKR
jgi:hypothetical protein